MSSSTFDAPSELSFNHPPPSLSALSLYPMVLNEAHEKLQTNAVPTMLAVSHGLEDVVIQHRATGTFYATFQRMSAFLPQVNRFAKLAAVCGEVLVFGVPDVPTPTIPNVSYIHLEPDWPLAQEWITLFINESFAGALFARQTDDDSNRQPAETSEKAATVKFGRGRYYNGLVTFNPQTVATARRAFDHALARPVDTISLDSEAYDLMSPIGTFGRSLMSYLEKQNQELAGLYNTLTVKSEAIENLNKTVRTMLSRTAWEEAKLQTESDEPNTPPNIKRRQLTILHSDIAGFTEMTESLPPHIFFPLLNKYFDLLATTVYQGLGDVDKFLGDGMLAFFENPIAALHAAILIQRRVKIFNDQRTADSGFHFPTRISIATGPCLLAHIGSRGRQEVTILGDTVNLASRLEAHSPIGGLIMDDVTYLTANHPPSIYKMIQVRGKKAPVDAYEVPPEDINDLSQHLKRNMYI